MSSWRCAKRPFTERSLPVVEKIILVIGSVTSKQYRVVRPRLLREGIKAKIVRIEADERLERGWLIHELRRYYRKPVGGEDFQLPGLLKAFNSRSYREYLKDYDEGGWLEWRLGIKKGQVAAVVIADEQAMMETWNPLHSSGPHTELMTFFECTWGDSVEPMIYIVGDNGKAFELK